MVVPKISVIVPVYNTEKYLHRCVDSILAQNYTDFELLLVNDGSTDSSGTICEEYAQKDNRVRVFHKENGGVSSARNIGMDNARGEWITFVDSDDFVFDNYLENFDVNNNKDYDLISQGLKIDKNFNGSSVFGFSFNGGVNDWLNKATEYGVFGYTVIKLFKLEVIKNNNIRFNTEIRFQEDELFVLSYLSECISVKSVSNVGYFYFVPDWGKYIGGNVESKLFRTNLMIDVLRKEFTNTEDLDIYKKKKSSLVHYYLEANIQHLNKKYLVAMRNLFKEGYGISYMPRILNKLITIDSTLVTLTFLIISLKIYSKIANRKIEYI